MLNFVENDVLDYIREKLKNVEQTDTKLSDILLLFEEKEVYLNALLGDFGNNRFYEKLKGEFFTIVQEYFSTKDNSITPYLLEFQISTAFSLLRLWLRRQKDLTPEKLFNLIDTLVTSGILSAI